MTTPFMESGSGKSKKSEWPESIMSIPVSKLRSLTFTHNSELEEAIRRIWDNPTMQCMPREYADGQTLIVPLSALEWFQEQEFQFVVEEVLSAADLSSRERVALRKAHGIY